MADIISNSLIPLKIHLHVFVTDTNNKSGQWLFRKLLISYDADIEDTNCQVFESGDIIEEETTVVNTTDSSSTDDDAAISTNNMKFIFLCVSQLNECYDGPINHANHRYFVRILYN